MFRTVEMVTAETKIFSVAVQPGKSDTSSGRPVVLRDVEGQMVDRPVILNRKLEDNSDSEFQPVLRDNEPAPAPAVMEMEREAETKKSKKNKKKNKPCEQPSVGSSSAEESRDLVEVERSDIKSKKKKTKKEKTPEPQPEVSSGGKCEEIFEEFVKEDITYPEDFSPDKDLVEFSEEEKIVEIDDNEDSEKVEFFIREKSSSVESDLVEGSVRIDGSSAKPNPWFNNFLQKSSSLIEDQIFGAAKKYEDQEDRQEDDEEMLELEKNQSTVETNIAALLEDDEDTATVRVSRPEFSNNFFLIFKLQETQSGRLPVILKLEPKQPVEPYSRSSVFTER